MTIYIIIAEVLTMNEYALSIVLFWLLYSMFTMVYVHYNLCVPFKIIFFHLLVEI